MDRLLRIVLLVAVVIAFCAPVALAREAGMPGAGLREGKAPGPRAGNMPKEMADRFKKMQDARAALTPLAGTEKGKAELQRYRTETEPLLKSAQELRDKVKKEVEAGATLQDAVKNHLDEAKELAKKLLAAYATYLENMLKLAKDEGGAVVDQLADSLLKEPERRPPEARAQGVKKPEVKKTEGEKGVENPFNN